MSHVDLTRVFPIRRPRFPGARWLLGVAMAALLLGYFWALGVFSARPAGGAAGPFHAAALFFTAILSYIVPTFGYISERTMNAIDALRPVLRGSPGQLDEWRSRVYRKPVRWLASVLVIGVVSGIAHNLLLYGSFEELWRRVAASNAEIAIVSGTCLVWLVVTTVVAALLDNALLLRSLARGAQVRLLDIRTLRPFATVAVISTLALIGAQAAFPIMNLDDEIDAVAYIPGLLGTGGPMLLLAALPVWPVHRRIAATKREALARIQQQIDTLAPADARLPEDLPALLPLLAYRREIQAVSEWPFDVGVVTRLALYLIIPPLTWVGAALIENVVNAFL